MIPNVLSPRGRWLLVAAAGSILLLVLGWWLLISPQRATAADRLSQVTDAQTQAAVTRSKLRALESDNAHLGKYKSQLKDLQQAMPGGPSSAEFVSDMQTLSKDTGVTITSISITPPSSTADATPTTTTVAGVTELPITVAASGPTTKLEKFLTQLQTKEKRALLVTQVTESAPESGGGSSAKNQPTISVQMTAFFTGS